MRKKNMKSRVSMIQTIKRYFFVLPAQKLLTLTSTVKMKEDEERGGERELTK